MNFSTSFLWELIFILNGLALWGNLETLCLDCAHSCFGSKSNVVRFYWYKECLWWLVPGYDLRMRPVTYVLFNANDVAPLSHVSLKLSLLLIFKVFTVPRRNEWSCPIKLLLFNFLVFNFNVSNFHLSRRKSPFPPYLWVLRRELLNLDIPYHLSVEYSEKNSFNRRAKLILNYKLFSRKRIESKSYPLR